MNSKWILCWIKCNIAQYFLCNPEQAESIIYYVIKYVTKDKTSIAASLTLPKKSCQNVLLHPSVDNSSGTDVKMQLILSLNLLIQIWADW